jgi:hypothetical protein
MATTNVIQQASRLLWSRRVLARCAAISAVIPALLKSGCMDSVVFMTNSRKLPPRSAA